MSPLVSLSGGGLVGLYSVALFAEMDRQPGTRVTAHFDLSAGTLIGGGGHCARVCRRYSQ